MEEKVKKHTTKKDLLRTSEETTIKKKKNIETSGSGETR